MKELYFVKAINIAVFIFGFSYLGASYDNPRRENNEENSISDIEEIISCMKAEKQTVEVNTVAVDRFVESRKKFSYRPKPENMNFEREKIQSYINTLPTKEIKKIEIKRCNRVFKVKQYLLKLFTLNPYVGEIQPPNGKTFSGCVSMANEKTIGIRPRGAEKSIQYKWDELGIEQYEKFFNYYAEQRLRSSGGAVSRKDSICFAAEDYLLFALLCDWLGKYDKAYEYAVKAAMTSPDIVPEVNELFFDDIPAYSQEHAEHKK